MVRKLISGAMRSTFEDLLSKPLHDLVEGQRDLVAGQQQIWEALRAQTARIDALGTRLDQRIEAQGTSLSQRIDALSAQQGRLTAEVAEFRGEFRGEVASLKRDRDSADDQAHRITRIEDRVFGP
jgi:chromosome segregation ATPase